MHQHLVTDAVSVSVIDALKKVDVDDHHVMAGREPGGDMEALARA